MGICFLHFLNASKSEAALDRGHVPSACKGRALLHVSVACISGPGGGPYGMLVSHPWRKDWPPLIHVVALRTARQTQVSSKAFVHSE